MGPLSQLVIPFSLVPLRIIAAGIGCSMALKARLQDL